MSIKFASDDGKTPKTLKTHITGYYLAIDRPEDLREHNAIKAERRAAGVKCFNVSASTNDGHPANADIELETDFIFNNQWNTTDGRRVFDWYEGIYPNRQVKSGHYLTITPQMVTIRKTTFKCGYCGKNYHGLHNAGAFCPACLGSEYLKDDQVHLLRVMPCDWDGRRPELTAAERADLMPIYIEKQTTDTTTRAAQRKEKIRADVIAKAGDRTSAAMTERDGFLWLLDRNINTENVIYYDHKRVFCIGWRQPLNSEVRTQFEKLLKGFPFKVEFK